jgi:uncharacterized repeat protein (TIGR03806 family)
VLSTFCATALVGALLLSTGCRGGSQTPPAGSAGTSGGAGTGGAAGTDAGASPDAGSDAGTMAACSAPANAAEPIAKLTQTGCVDPRNPTKMASVVIPYELNSPLWSDNADKSRGMVIPAGKKIHVKDCAATPAECPQGAQDSGKWVMPVGTVMVKNFGFDGKLIETRLLVHTDDTTWNGYSYQWNEAQSEATIVPPDEDPSLNNMRLQATFNTGMRAVTWTFPYRFDCNGCHTKEAGGSLGPETRQMNRGAGQMNQITRFSAMALFDTAPTTPYQAALVLPYSGQLGTAPTGMVEARARSYIHANCAYCHRPDGTFNTLDFRLDTAFKDMGACGGTPMKGDVGVAGAQIFKPGKPMESTMWLRMHAPWTGDKTRMPQLATYVVDDLGLALLGEWITSVAACPQ